MTITIIGGEKFILYYGVVVENEKTIVKVEVG